MQKYVSYSKTVLESILFIYSSSVSVVSVDNHLMALK